jgi:hypothetical protein
MNQAGRRGAAMMVALLVLSSLFAGTPAVVAQGAGWAGAYYPNRDLQGSPVLTRTDPELLFNWNGASPGPNVPGQNWSARWEQVINFPAGDYTFTAQVDDGMRLYLDGTLLINAWSEGALRTVSAGVRGVRAGAHTVRVEYFQAAGASALSLRSDRGVVAPPAPQPPAPPAPPPQDFPEWKGEYFNDINLQGAPLMVRNDPAVDFNWGLDSPDPRVPADNFSVRWTRRANFEKSGDYIFNARTSDGVRIYLDGLLVLDEWRDTPDGEYKTYTSRFYGLSDGYHNVRVEYYERGGIAYAMVWWSRYTGEGEPED